MRDDELNLRGGKVPSWLRRMAEEQKKKRESIQRDLADFFLNPPIPEDKSKWN